ncbi:MAG TPA: NAD-dependent epimerase/dehydratase family protein [Acidimicrobiales bacterium]
MQLGCNSWRDRNVLVTGAGGFIGSGLAEELVRRGANVVGILRDSRGLRLLRERGIAEEVDVVGGSITDSGLVERTLNEYEIDTIFHLAAQTLVTVANSGPSSTFESNIRGTWVLLEAVRGNPSVQRVVCASSDKAYGHQPVLPYTEDTPLQGVYPYDASKVCSEVLVRSYCESFRTPVAVVRAANIYGPGDLNWNRLVPGTIRSLLRGEVPLIRSDGTLERDYLYLDDVVSGYLAVADHLPQVSGQAFNLGTQNPVSVLAMVEAIIEAVDGPRIEPKVLGIASNEIDRQSLAFAKAFEMLGWTPSTDLAQGLRRTVPWYARYLASQAGATFSVAALKEEVHA